jgi:hypothetical protein
MWRYSPLVVAVLSIAAIQVGDARKSEPLMSAGRFGLLAVAGVLVAVAVKDWTKSEVTPGQKRVMAATFVLYGLACLVPAVYLDEGGPPTSDLDFRIGSPIGLAVLCLGWMFWWSVPWSANLLLLLGVSGLARRRFRLACVLGVLGAVVALSSWFCVENRLLVGYYLWQASFLVFAVGAAVVGRAASEKGAKQGRESI